MAPLVGKWIISEATWMAVQKMSPAGLDDGAIGLDEISSVVGTQPKRKQMVNSVEIAEVKIFL